MCRLGTARQVETTYVHRAGCGLEETMWLQTDRAASATVIAIAAAWYDDLLELVVSGLVLGAVSLSVTVCSCYCHVHGWWFTAQQ